MKLFVSILLTALLGYAIVLFLPWWTFVFTSCTVAIVIPQKSIKSFATGFAGIFLLWAIQAYILDINNDHILSQKVAAIFQLGNSSVFLIFISAFIGGLISAFAALTGSFARK